MTHIQHTTTRPSATFLRPKPPKRTEDEKRAQARSRQNRYLTSLDLRGEAPTNVIAAALLASLATASDFEELQQSNPLVRSMLDRLIQAGYDPRRVIRRVRDVRRRLLNERPGDAEDRKRRTARSLSIA